MKPIQLAALATALTLGTALTSFGAALAEVSQETVDSLSAPDKIDTSTGHA